MRIEGVERTEIKPCCLLNRLDCRLDFAAAQFINGVGLSPENTRAS